MQARSGPARPIGLLNAATASPCSSSVHARVHAAVGRRRSAGATSASLRQQPGDAESPAPISSSNTTTHSTSSSSIPSARGFGRRRLLQLGAAAAAAALAPWGPAAPRPAQADVTLLVGPPESGGKFRTIGEAIAAAAAGSTITILPGRYEERLVVEGKFLTIQSAQRGRVEVVWMSSRPYEHTLECKATQGAVVVRGLTLRHYSKSVAQNYCVLVQSGASLVLDSCDVSSNSGVGVGVEGATLQLLDSTVHDCARHGVAAYGGFEGAPGRCLVQGCTIAGNKMTGVHVRDGGTAVLRSNNVTGNGEFGVALLDGCTARLFDNQVTGNGAGSVQVDVGSVAVDVAELAAKNALDTPAQALTV